MAWNMDFVSTGLLILLGMSFGLAVSFWSLGSAERPTGPLPGSAFEKGEIVEGPASWSTLSQTKTVELQLLTPPRSRTTWLVVVDGVAYIPSGIPKLIPWKRWPHQALEDGRALVRHDGRIYPVELVPVEDAETFGEVAQQLAKKYDRPVAGPDEMWLFRLDPRPTLH